MLQNELNIDVARFTSRVQTCLATIQVVELRTALCYPNAWIRQNSKGLRDCQMLEKRNFIPMQNKHNLLVVTLWIGIPSLLSLVSVVDRESEIKSD